MVHVGKPYPYLNVSRLFAPTPAFPLLAPTEYDYSLFGVTGPGASGLVASGRGIFPNTYAPGDTSIVYQGNVGSYSGSDYDLIFVWGLASGAYPLTCDVQLLWGGSLIGQLFSPMTWPETFQFIGTVPWTGWNDFGGTGPITNIVLTDLTGVPWSASPPPPDPHLF